MFYDSFMHTHTHIFTHCALYHPLKIVASGYGLAPPLSYHFPVPFLSVSLVGPLSCIWDLMCVRVWCVCVLGIQGKCQLTRALHYHEPLWVVCLFLVWRFTVSCIYGHSHWQFVFSVCVGVLAFVCLHECKPMRESTSTSHLLFSLSTFLVKQNTAVLKVTFKNKRFSNHHLL